MKLTTLALLAIGSLVGGAGHAQDSWTGRDKPKHIAASAVSAAIVEGLFADTWHPAGRFALAMAPGVLKEFADMRRGGSGFSGKDIVADLIGASFGTVYPGIVVRPGYVGISIRF